MNHDIPPTYSHFGESCLTWADSEHLETPHPPSSPGRVHPYGNRSLPWRWQGVESEEEHALFWWEMGGGP